MPSSFRGALLVEASRKFDFDCEFVVEENNVWKAGSLVRKDDVGFAWKVGELVKTCGRGTDEGIYNREDDGIANTLPISSLKEHNQGNTTRSWLVTKKENNDIVHIPLPLVIETTSP